MSPVYITETILHRRGYTTVPQVYATEEVEDLPAGKGVGGSSLVNGENSQLYT